MLHAKLVHAYSKGSGIRSSSVINIISIAILSVSEANQQSPSRIYPFCDNHISLIVVTNPISKKEIKALQKIENKQLQEHYYKEVREFLAKNKELQIHIPTDEAGNIVGLKAKW
jgi:hypothetical protein